MAVHINKGDNDEKDIILCDFHVGVLHRMYQ